MRILVIDDHQLFRAGMVLVLRQFHPDAQVSEASSVTQALLNVSASTELDLILMDWHLPQEDPNANVQRIKSQWPKARLVVVSAMERLGQLGLLPGMGVAGYIPKSASPQVLMSALAKVVQGETYMPTTQGPAAPVELEATFAATRPPNLDFLAPLIERLTPRQRQVLHKLQQGLPNKQIGRELDIAEDTVKQHLSIIYEVLGVRGRTEALSLLTDTSQR